MHTTLLQAYCNSVVCKINSTSNSSTIDNEAGSAYLNNGHTLS